MDRRNTLAAIGLSLAVALAGCAGARVRHPIEGDWSVSSATMAGQLLPPGDFDGATLHLDGGRYAFRDDHGDYVVLPGTQPSALDLHGLDGPNAGTTILAIFVIKDDTLTVAYDLSGTARPTRFESRPGTRQFLVRYHRS